MKTYLANFVRQRKLAFLLSPFLGFSLVTRAQTSICGTIDTTTWTPAGNPYIIGCDSTVPCGQTLTLQPGVIVWLGSGVTLTVNGSIQAVGSPANHITFRAPVVSEYWNKVQLNYCGATNRFKYCDFQNASTAVSVFVYGGNATNNAEFLNCVFSNCVSQAIYGEALGYAASSCPFEYYSDAAVDLTVKNCRFSSMSNGCVIKISGQLSGCGGPVIGYGYARSSIVGSIFENLGGAAFLMSASSYAGNSQPSFKNNTLINCRIGTDYSDPWVPRIENNVFVGSTNAAKRAGSGSVLTSNNDFYSNATNFTGYPTNYGVPIIPNRNGTMADLFFNIFENPLFVAANDFRLAMNSPCVDAGTGDPANYDSCFQVSRGSVTNDIGAYGGPDACNWIAPAESYPVFSVGIQPYVGVTINPATNGHYRLEFAPALCGDCNTNNWTQLTNLTLSAPFTYYDPVFVGQRFYRAVLLP